MITCKELHEFLMRYLENELSEAERSSFEGHLGICPSCIDYIDSYKTTVGCGEKLRECDEQELFEAPEALIQAILKARKQADQS